MRLLLPVLILAVASLSGCGVRDRFFSGSGSGVAADALPFRAALTRGEDRRDFSVRVYRAGGASLERARESARFPATRYCLSTFGGSDVDWALDASGDWAVAREGDDLIVSGRCISRA